MRRSTGILLGLASGLLLLLVLAARCAYAQLGDGPFFEREPSPTGAYEVVRETRSFFLDGYTTLWICARGEPDPRKWHRIAPEVDGSYHTEWLGPTALLITNHGWPEPREPFSVSTWGDVRIELRRRPACSTADSPDTLHRVDVWTYEDSRGRRTGAILSTNWNNPTSGSTWLCDEGPWFVQGRWRANDHLELRVEPNGSMPSIPPSWHGIRITVVDR